MAKANDGDIKMLRRREDDRKARLERLTEKEANGALSPEDTAELQAMREQDGIAEGRPDQLGGFGRRM